MWGSLFAGAAGLEWYFGAHQPHNDLTSEDWRQRDRLWELTEYAKVFFEDHLPFWEMKPANELIKADSAFCFRKSNDTYAIYLPKSGQNMIDLSEATGQFQVFWYNPLLGGPLQEGSIQQIEGGSTQFIGLPEGPKDQDWVVLVKK